jgi:hypothetical protein
MRKPVTVETPHPTVWETAKTMEVSKKRELIKMADEGLARWRAKHKAERAQAPKKRLKTA